MMKPYPSYNDSDVEWIGEIPYAWRTIRIKYLTREHRQGYYSSDPYDNIGYRIVRITDISDNHEISVDNSPFYNLDSVDYKRFCMKKGDFLFPRTGGVGRFGIYRLETKSIYGSFLIRFRFNDLISVDLLKYHFESHIYLNQIKSEIHGGVNQNVHVENIKGCILPIQSNKEQAQIIEFLDKQTHKIDDLIKNTEKKIELLKEKRTALINHCVTKGLNPDVEMKDSGVSWIGEIPKHWVISKFKYLSEIVTGNTPSKTMEELYYTDLEDGFVWVKPTSLNKGLSYINESEVHLTEEGMRQTRLIPKDSSMICCIGNTIGKHSISGIELSTNQQINSVIPDQQILHPWFCLFYVNVFTRDLLKWSNFVTLPIHTKSDLEDTPFILPPLYEQNQIVAYIEERYRKIDSTIEIETKRIELLKEYRQALISNVVTGKIDVRDEVAI